MKKKVKIQIEFNSFSKKVINQDTLMIEEQQVESETETFFHKVNIPLKEYLFSKNRVEKYINLLINDEIFIKKVKSRIENVKFGIERNPIVHVFHYTKMYEEYN